jgi:beta-glucosidase
VRVTERLLIGAATSAWQVEGSLDGDGRGPSIWDSYPGAGEFGAVGCDSYRRWKDDVALLESLGLHAYRFSIAWPRVMPTGSGRVEPRGLDYYDRLVDALLGAGIVPMATLYHWDLPVALSETGGWASRDTAERFADYTSCVASRLGDRVAWWATINEPFCTAYLGYATAQSAPGRKDYAEARAASHHQLLAHGLAVPRLRSLAPASKVGIVINPIPCEFHDESQREAAERFDRSVNRWFLDPLVGRDYPTDQFWGGQPPVENDDLKIISAPIDYLGVNYYTPYDMGAPAPGGATSSTSEEAARSDIGWAVRPDTLLSLLRRLHRDYGFPELVITECGAAYADDIAQLDFHRQHVAAAEAARAEGVPVSGYFAWSLLESVEWGSGFSARFGICTRDREPRPAARWLSEVARGMATSLR